MTTREAVKKRLSTKTSEDECSIVKGPDATLTQRKHKVRYKLLLIFEELVEMTDEMLDSEKIILTYSFLGLEGKFTLSSENFDRKNKAAPIKKVKLYYFFGNSVAEVNELLRQKDVTAAMSNRKRE
eukprot:TRINITY_DN1553_c0_g2_i3.p5 TRINITY_DN1553_c0_g2~~TRINITY_DN1553_c0_g2_i3.p5  ORF type:complete len:126 (-),score=33.68 TRINITY_DN1553_c0_g2_i3:422-799(-)